MCVGFESLVRWTRNGKPVSPVTFIPIAEELGIIEPLGTWVLQQACTTFADWKRRFPAGGLDYITVNVSSRQLMQQDFLWIVEQAVHNAGLKPCDLRLEITETALMDSPNEAAKLLRELREFGVKIYLDDFGSGYSSLSHLHKLPVDALKIDRSFVKSLLLPDRPAIVESILALARTLNTSVVAEGIEERRAGARAGAPWVHARPGLPLLASAVDPGCRGTPRGQPAARPEEGPAIGSGRRDRQRDRVVPTRRYPPTCRTNCSPPPERHSWHSEARSSPWRGWTASAAASRSAAGTARFRFGLFRSRGRSTAAASLVHSRQAPAMLGRPSRIVVTVIAAIRTFTAQFVNWESGRPRRLAAPDAVRPLNAVVVPDGGGR